MFVKSQNICYTWKLLNNHMVNDVCDIIIEFMQQTCGNNDCNDICKFCCDECVYPCLCYNCITGCYICNVESVQCNCKSLIHINYIWENEFKYASYNSCFDCSRKYCELCKENCNTACNHNICLFCINKCGQCMMGYCNDHNITCSVCEGHYCYTSHFMECIDCNKYYCENITCKSKLFLDKTRGIYICCL